VIIAVLFLAVGLTLCCTTFQPLLERHGVSRDLFLSYASIPIVCTIFTYVHIWAALYMTFYPLRYMGCLQIPETNAGCGWQGIIPNKAGKMARTSVELMTAKIIKVRDVVEQIDGQRIANLLEPFLKSTVPTIFQSVAMQEEHEIWSRLPERVQKELIHRANKDTSKVVQQLVDDVKTNIESVFDLAAMVENAFVQEPELLNHMFISCGYDELKFIRDFGAYMGGVFGIVQVCLWIVYSAGWTLPAFGFVVGILTNWLALKMIFEPVDPVFFCGIKLHGLFLQRQEQVSEVYAQIVADNVLYARNIIRAILRGHLTDQLFNILHRHVGEATDIYIGSAERVVMLFRSEKHISKLKQAVAKAVMKELPDTAQHVESYMNEAMGLEELLKQKLKRLPCAEFEGLLHPVFQEDEWKLVLMGGVLGVVIGCAQWRFLGS